MTPSWPKYTKTPPQTSGNFYFLIEKSPKTAFLRKTFKKYDSDTFLRNRSMIKNIFSLRPF
jgi:hypothetical protein